MKSTSVYLLVSCLRRPSCAPSGCCGRWASWDMTELRVLTPDVRAWSSCVVRATDPKSPSSSSSTSSASLSAPSLSDAGPKCVCSSWRETDAKTSEQVLCFLYFCPSLSLTHTHTHTHTHTPGIKMVTAACTARLMMLSMANIQWGLMWWFLNTLFTCNKQWWKRNINLITVWG